MNGKDRQLQQEAWNWLKPTQTVHLATWDGQRPRVRPMAMIFDDGRFWVSTGAEDAKMKQVMENPVFEFSMMLESEEGMGTMRCGGRASVVSDVDTKAMMAQRIPFFNQYWDSHQDPSFGLIQLLVDEVEFMRPGEMFSSKFKV